jgi:TQXA domain-containing protein/LPXTG-motif cell wall-anchored protein
MSGTGSGAAIQTDSGALWAGLIYLAVDGGGSVTTYCIDLNTATSGGVPYTEADWSEGTVPNLGLVTWVLRHGYPTVSTGSLLATINLTREPDLGSLSANAAAAGTQAAVWHFTDNSNLTGSNPDGIVAVYEYLVGNAVALSEPAPSIEILPAVLDGIVGERIGPFTLTTSAPSVDLTGTGGAITDSAGNPLTAVMSGGTFYVTLDAEGTAEVTASATAALSSGRVFVTTAGSPKQKLITASTTTAVTTASVVVTAAFEEEEEEATTTTLDSGAQGPIPDTGTTTTATLALGAGMLLMGGAVVMTARRRRI